MFDFSSFHFYISVLMSVANGIILCYVAYKFFHIIQLSSYKIKSYFSWIKTTKGKYFSRLFMLCFFSSAGLIVTNVLFDAFQTNKYISYLGLIFYFVFCGMFINLNKEPKVKNPLKYTRRMNRLITATFFIGTIITFLLIWFSMSITSIYRFSIVAITPLLVPILVPFVHFLLLPIENTINNCYIKRAKKVLANMPDLIKIGITGSYGKTSTKYILNTLLSEKYRVCYSPSSFNTPMGLCRTILENLHSNHQILICEMGAIQKGEIEYLCKFINPTISCITSVCNQHLDTFKTLENIKNTKYEIMECLPDGGLGVFNGDNETVNELYQLDLPNRIKKIVKINDELVDVSCFEIISNEKGLNFELAIKGRKRIKCQTRLLGVHNLQNILMAVCIADYLELTDEQIKRGISKLIAPSHRLEIIDSPSGAIVIDDSFNASVGGVQSALKVLAEFTNRRKIIVTPGLVDLGIEQEQSNIEFAKAISKVCDKVVLVNTINRESLKKGLIESNYSDDNIKICDNLLEAQEYINSIITSQDVVLYENDLPDNYI